jgi:hypothetical protein
MPGGFGMRFALASLATWRVTHLLAEEDGPAETVVRLRAWAGEGWIGELMDCFYCLSAWVAAPLAITVTPRRREAPLVWLALSGAACLLERATGSASRGRFDLVADEAGERHPNVTIALASEK